MAKNTEIFICNPATGGLDTNRNPSQVSPQRLVRAKNIVFDTATGARKKRPGISQFYSSGITSKTNVQGIYDFFRTVSGSQVHYPVLIADAKVYYATNTGDFIDITGTATLSATDRPCFDVFLGFLIMTFTGSVPHAWDQSGNIETLQSYSDTLLGAGYCTVPNGRVYRTHLGCGWMGGISGAPHRLWRSVAGNPLNWKIADGAEYFDVDAGDRDPTGITALFPSFHGDLYVAKRKNIHRVYYDSSGTFGVESVVSGIGCISPNTVVAFENDIIFCSERGVHSLSATDEYGDVKSAFLSEKIHKTYQDELNFTRINEMWAVYDPELQSYLLNFPRKGSANVTDVLGYNLVSQEWYRWENTDVATMCSWINNYDQTKTLLVTSNANSGYIDSSTHLDYGSAPITTLCKTGVIYPYDNRASLDATSNGDPMTTRNFKNITVFFRPKGDYYFTVSYRIDAQATQTLTFDQSGYGGTPLGEFTLGVDTLGFSGQVKRQTLPISGIGSGIEITFQQVPATLTSLNEDVEILGYAIEYKPAGYDDNTNIAG